MVSLFGYSQILTNSNLPIIKINTGGVYGSYIPDEPKIPASFQIIDNGSGVLNNINDIPNHYDGYCGIETREIRLKAFLRKHIQSNYGIVMTRTLQLLY